MCADHRLTAQQLFAHEREKREAAERTIRQLAQKVKGNYRGKTSTKTKEVQCVCFLLYKLLLCSAHFKQNSSKYFKDFKRNGPQQKYEFVNMSLITSNQYLVKN